MRWHCCVQVFIVSSKKIQERNYETLFKWITHQKGNIIARVVLSVPPPWQVCLHCAAHLSATSRAPAGFHTKFCAFAHLPSIRSRILMFVALFRCHMTCISLLGVRVSSAVR